MDTKTMIEQAISEHVEKAHNGPKRDVDPEDRFVTRRELKEALADLLAPFTATTDAILANPVQGALDEPSSEDTP